MFTFEEICTKNLNNLFNIWEATLAPFDTAPPFTSAADLHKTIDSTPYGDLWWEIFTIHYNLDNNPHWYDEVPAAWKMAEYDSWFHDPQKVIHNILANHMFNKEFNYVTYQEFDTNGKDWFHNVFSDNWCWWEAVSNYITSWSQNSMLNTSIG